MSKFTLMSSAESGASPIAMYPICVLLLDSISNFTPGWVYILQKKIETCRAAYEFKCALANEGQGWVVSETELNEEYFFGMFVVYKKREGFFLFNEVGGLCSSLYLSHTVPGNRDLL
jgi:hypothetical protein